MTRLAVVIDANFRNARVTDNNRIARACGATIAHRTDELKEEDVGTQAGLFEIQKFGDEYFCFITECTNPKACTILLRGASKDILAEVERNLQDAMCVTRNVMLEPSVVPGGGAVEMAVGKVRGLLETTPLEPLEPLSKLCDIYDTL